MSQVQQGIQSFYTLLLEGRADDLLSLFAEDAIINTPLQGEVKGKTAFMQYVSEQQVWLKEREAKTEHFALIKTGERVVAESVLSLKQLDKVVALPVSIIADLKDEAISAIRIYHSTWPLTGKHILRTPLMTPTKGLEEPEIVERYMKGIAQPDEKAVLALFVPEGYVREPSGAQYKHAGDAGRQAFYDVALANGGIPLQHCTATFDGTRFAVEYICDTWGQATFPAQAGMAVYEVADADHLIAVRIYDDVSPPSETAA